jgi:hypothetical protein
LSIFILISTHRPFRLFNLSHINRSLTLSSSVLHSFLHSIRRLLARHSLLLNFTMLYSAIFSLALAVATEGLKQEDNLRNDLQTRDDISDGLTRRALRDRLPVAGPVHDRYNVPGRPRWRGQGNKGSSPEYPYLFAAPLPIPDVAVPMFTETVNGVPIDY